MNQPTKAYVNQTGTPPTLLSWHGHVPVRSPNNVPGGSGGVAPPFLGGFNATGQFSGLMTALPQGAQVLVLSEGDTAYGGMYPSASVAMTDVPNKLPSLATGETVIYGPTGLPLLTAKSTGLTLANQTTTTSANTGSATALPAQPAGYLSLSINGSVVKLPYFNP